MKWFKGPIPEAIQVSRQRGSLFLVYISGTDDLSEQMNATWESEAVGQFCDDNGVIAIQMLNTSEECKFFSQIYPVVVVPSTFCIGVGGMPLEVIGGHVSPEEFLQKLQNTKQTFDDQKQNAPSPEVTQQTDTPGAGETTPVASTSTTGTGETNPETSSSTPGGADGDQASALSKDKKMERAKELMEKKKVEKAQADFEKKREEEVKRRKLGHDLHKLKQSQQEMEMKEVREKLKKDKEDDKKAKEKIKAQIARDREERQAKFKKEKQERDEVMEEGKKKKLLEQQRLAAETEARNSETARIQVRLPDGSSVMQSFPSTETLQSLSDFVSERVGGRVTISTTFPKRRFTQEDMSSTFAELQLAPSAVVIAMPEGHSSRQASSSSMSPSRLFSILFMPFTLLWNFLYSLLFGGGGNSNTSQQQSSQSSYQSQTNSRTNRPTTARQRQPPGRQDGNMRRMTDMRDDDDDRTTYNGNSTQQL